MPVSFGCVANVYNEAQALPGWLEAATSYFDDVRVLHAGPGGAWSTDGTLEILKKWKIPVLFGKIDDGFGAVRTQAVRFSPCDWVMLLDADERFLRFAPLLTCMGEGTPNDQVSQILQEYDNREQAGCPSNFENLHKLGANLKVNIDGVYDQGTWLRDIIEHGSLDCVATVRRHWHDFSWQRPTQNWQRIQDLQYRIVRNHPSIHWDANVRMHEQLRGASNRHMPNTTHGPFFDHYHLAFKQMEPMRRAHAVAIYDAVHWGRPVPTEENFRKSLEAK